MKISFMLPKKSKIIVFGLTSDEVVEIFESNNINYTIYNELSRNININPIFVIKYFFNIIKCFRSYKILSLVYNVYHLTYLQLISPDYIFTQTDNSTLIHWLINHEKRIKFISIQNGIRAKHEFKFLKKHHLDEYRHDIFLMFGQHEEDIFNSMNIKINKSIKLGSLRLGLFLELKKKFTKKYDICLVSEFMELPDKSDKHYNIKKNVYEHLYAMHNAIAHYVNETNKKIIVALRGSKDSEIKYYKRIFKNNIEFRDKKTKYSSYEATCMSELTLALYSTLLLESLALGNKVLSIDTSNSDLYFNYPDFIKHNYQNYDMFRSHLDKILNMSSDEYINLSKNILSNSMNINHNNYPHYEILKIAQGVN